MTIFDEFEQMLSQLFFLISLEEASKIVQTWPEWKRNIL